MNNIYIFCALYKFKYIILISLLFLFYLSNTSLSFAASQQETTELHWSFADHPQPSSSELTQGEKLKAESTFKEARSGDCERSTQISFNIYNAHYPRFAKSGNEAQRFLAWKQYHAVDFYSSENFCIIHSVYKKISDAKYETNLVFCGTYSHTPSTAQDQIFVQAVEELIAYVMAGSLEAMGDFLDHHRPGSHISLNPDVELYIRKYAYNNEFGLYNEMWYTGHLEPLLTPERIEFVNNAVQRGDFASVLNTTAPCQVRP